MHTLLPELSKTPLNDDQQRFLQQFIASLSPEQLAWAGGHGGTVLYKFALQINKI
jgi:hypothetical protein